MPSSGVQTCADRKSTRLNSSHLVISYAVFCLKKKQIPLATSIFPREYEKEVLPGQPEVGGSTHAGKLDIGVRVDPILFFFFKGAGNHAYLPFSPTRVFTN